MGDTKRLVVRVGDDRPPIEVVGRTAWALSNLIDAGERGCTPLTNPGPRWSDYIFKLRKAGLVIQTVDEKHGGTYAGQHARYVLRTSVTVLAREAA